MSSAARAHRRREERAQARSARQGHRPALPLASGGLEWGVQPGWFADLDALEEAKKQTHDLLLAAMGSSRRGGVRWRYWDGERATEVLAELWTAGLSDDENGYFRQLRAKLREFGGFLIVAMALGVPPGQKEKRSQ